MQKVSQESAGTPSAKASTLSKGRTGERGEEDVFGGWVWAADGQEKTGLMLNEAETRSITHAQGISVKTLAAYLVLSLAPRHDTQLKLVKSLSA